MQVLIEGHGKGTEISWGHSLVHEEVVDGRWCNHVRGSRLLHAGAVKQPRWEGGGLAASPRNGSGPLCVGHVD